MKPKPLSEEKIKKEHNYLIKNLFRKKHNMKNNFKQQK